MKFEYGELDSNIKDCNTLTGSHACKTKSQINYWAVNFTKENAKLKLIQIFEHKIILPKQY